MGFKKNKQRQEKSIKYDNIRLSVNKICLEDFKTISRKYYIGIVLFDKFFVCHTYTYAYRYFGTVKTINIVFLLKNKNYVKEKLFMHGKI